MLTLTEPVEDTLDVVREARVPVTSLTHDATRAARLNHPSARPARDVVLTTVLWLGLAAAMWFAWSGLTGSSTPSPQPSAQKTWATTPHLSD